MDFSLQSGNQISLKRDEKQDVLSFMTRKVNGDIDYINIVLLAISFAAILVSIALYFYNGSLASSVGKKRAALDQKQAALSNLPIDQIRLLFMKLKYANQFTGNYPYIETAFVILGKTIENSIVYSSFKIAKDRGGNFTLEITGSADSYKALAQQMNTFDNLEQKKFFENLKLKGFGLDKKTGRIGFSFTSGLRFSGIRPDEESKLLNLGKLDEEKKDEEAAKQAAPAPNP